MADISMCLNDSCPVAKKCYRHEAKKNEYRQAYMAFRSSGDKGCEDFIPMENPAAPKGEK